MKSILSLITLIIISLFTYFGIWHNQTPYPLQLNWDIYEHITASNNILKSHLSFLPSQISDTFTFNGYSPLFSILLSVPNAIFHNNLGVYYYLEYIYFVLTITATYFLAKKIFQNDWIAFIAGIFSIFIFENFIVYTSLFLIPQNLAALLTIFTLIYTLKEKVNKFILAGLLLIIFLMHYIIGSIGIAIILINILLRRISSEKLLNLGIITSTITLFAILSIHFFGNLSLTGREEALHFIFPLTKKLGFLLDWFSLSLLFLPFGYYSIFKKGSKEQKSILIITLLILGLSLAPLSYFLKFFVFDHYFLNLVLAAGMGFLIINLPKILKVLAVIWISFCLFFVFFKSQNAYKEPLYFNNYYSHVSYQELETSKWISKNLKDTMLISDPSTQYILEATSGINTPGGAYMSEGNRKIITSGDLEKVKTIKDKLNFENQATKRLVLALSGRYFAWIKLPENQRLSFYYNIWKPTKLTAEDKMYINSLESAGFKILYQNDELSLIQL